MYSPFRSPLPPLSTRSFWVFPVHQAWALVSCIQPGLVKRRQYFEIESSNPLETIMFHEGSGTDDMIVTKMAEQTKHICVGLI